MDEKIFRRQIFDLYKSTFEKTIGAVILFQEQNEKMVDSYMDQMTDISEKDRKAFQDWRESLKQGTLDFKDCMDRAFKKAEKNFSRPERS